MIENQKDLASLLKLCRKQGVTEIAFGGVSVKFGDLPPRNSRQADDGDEASEDPNVDPMTGLTSEQLAFYSATSNQQ